MALEAVETNIDPKDLNSDVLRKVGLKLKGRYEQYKKDRRHAETEWLKNLRQYNGEYDPEVRIPEDKSRAYPRITRMKVMGMVAKLMSLLFPEGEDNWSVASSEKPAVDTETLQFLVGQWQLQNPEQELTLDEVRKVVEEFVAEAAEHMNTRIRDQLSDAAEYGQLSYPVLARQVVKSAVLYSMGVLKGPMTIQSRGADYAFNDNGQVVIVDEQQYRPYFKFVRLWDYFPDMHASDFDSMDGQFERHILSKHQLLRLAERDDFFGDKIKAFVRHNPDGNHQSSNWENQLDTLDRSNRPSGSGAVGKYEVIEYWGSIYRSELEGMGVKVKRMDEEDGDEETEQNTQASFKDEEMKGTVWFVGDTVIKAAKDPFPEGAQMYHQFVFEDDDVNLTGSGMPPIVRDSQMGIANSARMALDNASSVAGPIAEVNTELLAPNQQGPRFESFEVIYREGSGAEAQVPAVRELRFDSRLNELLPLINQFKQFADEETFVNEGTTGGTGGIPGEALRTQGNASMILGNAALPFRDIVRNYDKFTVSVIHSLIQWNRIFSPHSNIDGDLRPVARGSTSLIAKEVRAAALDNLANTLTDGEQVHLDMRELARARIQVRDLPGTLIRSKEEAEADLRRQEEERQRQQQRLEEREDAELEQTRAETAGEQADAALTVAETASEPAQAELDMARAISERVKAGVSLAEAINQVVGGGNPPEQGVGGDSGGV